MTYQSSQTLYVALVRVRFSSGFLYIYTHRYQALPMIDCLYIYKKKKILASTVIYDSQDNTSLHREELHHDFKHFPDEEEQVVLAGAVTTAGRGQPPCSRTSSSVPLTVPAVAAAGDRPLMTQNLHLQLVVICFQTYRSLPQPRAGSYDGSGSNPFMTK